MKLKLDVVKQNEKYKLYNSLLENLKLKNNMKEVKDTEEELIKTKKHLYNIIKMISS